MIGAHDMSTLKVLLLGVGRWGNNHVRVLNSLPIELYVTDLNPNALDGARKVGVPENRLSTNYKDFASIVDGGLGLADEFFERVCSSRRPAS